MRSIVLSFWVVLVAMRRCFFVGLLACIVLIVFAATEVKAETNRTSAPLQIQVTVIPTVQTPIPGLRNSAPGGAVIYNLQTGSTPGITSQRTSQTMPIHRQELSGTSIISDGEKNIILESLTFVAP